eukprot:c18987_g1_i1 orf=177-437(+)
MRMVKGSWLSGCTAGQCDQPDAVVFHNRFSGLPAHNWLDVHGNGVMGKRCVESDSADICEANVEDLMLAVKVLLLGLGEDVNRDGI